MNKKRTYSLILLSLIITGLFGFTQTTFAAFTKEEVCQYVNYQYASVEDAQKNKDVAAKFEGKFITIAEERLGNPDNETTFNCFRQIACSMKDPETSTAKPSGGEAAAQNQGAQGNQAAADAKVVQVRKCTTTYEPTCDGQSGDSLIEAISNPKGEYTICEPVMIYLSEPGNNLLFYYMGQVYTFAATLGGLLAVLILIVAGIMYATAGDNNNQTTMAKGLITKSISGLIVLFLSALILYVINPNFFTANQASNEPTTPTTNEANP